MTGRHRMRPGAAGRELPVLLTLGLAAAVIVTLVTWTVATEQAGPAGLPLLGPDGYPPAGSVEVPGGRSGFGTESRSPSPAQVSPSSATPVPPAASSGSPGPGGAPSGSAGPPASPSAGPLPLSAYYFTTGTTEDGFAGQVVISNPAESGQSWQVVLRFPPGVATLRRYWVDGPGEVAAVRTGQVVTFAGTAQVPAAGSVTLGFEFGRRNDRRVDVEPVSCTVNGVPCAGVPG
jgi:hypothetical protein